MLQCSLRANLATNVHPPVGRRMRLNGRSAQGGRFGFKICSRLERNSSAHDGATCEQVAKPSFASPSIARCYQCGSVRPTPGAPVGIRSGHAGTNRTSRTPHASQRNLRACAICGNGVNPDRCSRANGTEPVWYSATIWVRGNTCSHLVCRAAPGCLNSFPRMISGVPPGLVVMDRRWSLAT